MAALNSLSDRPWCEFRNGKPLTQNTLATLLRPFEIRPRELRIGGDKERGYAKTFFEDAWLRYLGSETVQTVQSSIHAGETQISQTVQTPSVPFPKSEESPVMTRVVPLVPDVPVDTERRPA
jgi:hypothetical protein